MIIGPKRTDFTPFVGPAFRALRAHGCTGVRSFQSRRVHAGYDESAWSKPLIVAYGVSQDLAERTLREMGWQYDIRAE